MKKLKSSIREERRFHRYSCWLIQIIYTDTHIDITKGQIQEQSRTVGRPTAHNQRLAQDQPNDWWYPTCTCSHVECRRRESAQVTWLSGTWDTRSTLLSSLLRPDDASRGSQTTSTNSHLIYTQRTTNQFQYPQQEHTQSHTKLNLTLHFPPLN